MNEFDVDEGLPKSIFLFFEVLGVILDVPFVHPIIILLY